LLNLQTASFEIDVSPSKPVLYELMPEFWKKGVGKNNLSSWTQLI
jgi:hypothetical protein